MTSNPRCSIFPNIWSSFSRLKPNFILLKWILNQKNRIKLLFIILKISLPTRQLTSKRGKKFSLNESTELIEVIWKYLPILLDEWKEVANEHALWWKPSRTVTSVQIFFLKSINSRNQQETQPGRFTLEWRSGRLKKSWISAR